MVPGAAWTATGAVGQNAITGGVDFEGAGIGVAGGGIGGQTLDRFSVAIRHGGQGTALGASALDSTQEHLTSGTTVSRATQPGVAKRDGSEAVSTGLVVTSDRAAATCEYIEECWGLAEWVAIDPPPTTRTTRSRRPILSFVIGNAGRLAIYNVESAAAVAVDAKRRPGSRSLEPGSVEGVG